MHMTIMTRRYERHLRDMHLCFAHNGLHACYEKCLYRDDSPHDQEQRMAIRNHAGDTLYLHGRFVEKGTDGQPEWTISISPTPCMTGCPVIYEGRHCLMSSHGGEEDFPAVFNALMKAFSTPETGRKSFVPLAERVTDEKMELALSRMAVQPRRLAIS